MKKIKSNQSIFFVLIILIVLLHSVIFINSDTLFNNTLIFNFCGNFSACIPYAIYGFLLITLLPPSLYFLLHNQWARGFLFPLIVGIVSSLLIGIILIPKGIEGFMGLVYIGSISISVFFIYAILGSVILLRLLFNKFSSLMKKRK